MSVGRVAAGLKSGLSSHMEKPSTCPLHWPPSPGSALSWGPRQDSALLVQTNGNVRCGYGSGQAKQGTQVTGQGTQRPQRARLTHPAAPQLTSLPTHLSWLPVPESAPLFPAGQTQPQESAAGLSVFTQQLNTVRKNPEPTDASSSLCGSHVSHVPLAPPPR